MPHRVKRTHKYWCPGPWPWQWFDTCTRESLDWQYDFAWIDSTSYGFVSYNVGCEAGVRYTWYAPCFLVFGSHYYWNLPQFFSDQLSPSGRCDSSPSVRYQSLGPRLHGFSSVYLNSRQPSRGGCGCTTTATSSGSEPDAAATEDPISSV